MFFNDMNDSLPCIVVHAYLSNRDYEKKFWKNVRVELNHRGFELLVLSWSIETAVEKCSVFFSQAESYPDLSVPLKFNRCANIDRLLEREMLWCVAGDNNKRMKSYELIHELYLKFFSDVRPSLLVLGNGEHAIEFIIRDIAGTLNVPCIFMERGPFPKTWHIDENGVTARTSAAKEARVPWITDVTKWLDIFDKYETYYKNEKESWWGQPGGVGSLRRYFDIPDDKKIVVFANQLDADTSNFLNSPLFKDNLTAFQWFCDHIRKYYADEWFVIGKPHPLNTEPMHDFKNAVNGIGVWSGDVSLDDCLAEADRIAAVNSTVLYEALILRKPVLMLGKAILSNKDIAYEITNLDDDIVKSVMDSWISAENFDLRVSKWKLLGASLLADCLYYTDEESEISEWLNTSKELAHKLLQYAIPQTGGRFPYIFVALNRLIYDLHKKNLVYSDNPPVSLLAKYRYTDILKDLRRRLLLGLRNISRGKFRRHRI